MFQTTNQQLTAPVVLNGFIACFYLIAARLTSSRFYWSLKDSAASASENIGRRIKSLRKQQT
jgi:hypothetical protein